MATTIKAVSLLLERFGSLDTDYSIYLDVYEADSNGGPSSPVPIITQSKSAKDINNKDWYNFVFTTPIIVSGDHVLFTLRQDTHITNEDFIVWVNSNISTTYPYGYALDSNTISTDSNFLGYYTVYDYGYNSVEMDFFSVFGFSVRNDFSRCIKIYENFNDITETSEGYDINIPGYEDNVISLNNRQDWISGFKSNVEILGDILTLKGVGRRIGFIDRSENDGFVHPSNIGLPPSVLSFDFSDGDDEFGCIGFAGSELDGLYNTTNSGASWSKTTSFTYNNITSIKISPASGSPKTIAVAAMHPYSKLFISEDSGATWNNGVSIPSGDKINDIAWQDSNTLYISTESIGVYKYIVNTNTLSSFNGGLASSLPVGRKIYVDYDQGQTFAWIYGYGYGSGYGTYSSPDFFDVFNVAGSTIGYPATNSNNVRINTYGFEYFSYRKVYWTTDNGLYVNDLTYDWFRIGEDDGIDDCYSVYANGDLIYVGIDTGLGLSNDSGVTFYTNKEGDSIKIKGLLERPVTQISFDSDNNLFYVSQNGSLSSGSGVFFQQNMNDLTFDTNIVNMVINPLNTDFIHILTQSNLGNNDYATFLIDNSSSISFSDPNNKRRDIVENISDSIYSSNNRARFQIIQFEGTNPEIKGSITSEFSGRGEAINITEGFVLNNDSDSLQSSINEIGTSTSELKQLTTPLIDSLNITMKSIISGGMDWTYDSSRLLYKSDFKRDDNASIAEHTLFIVTDGKDLNSLIAINDFVENNEFKNKIKIRCYIIIIGYDYNREIIYNLSSFFNSANLFFCNSDENIDDSISYISSIEQKNITEGIFRKSFLLNDDFAEVNSISISCRIPSTSKIQLQYRYSENNDKLLNESFTDPINIEDGSTEISVPNVQCKFFEIQIYMKKEETNNFPLINEIEISYRTPSESKIVFNEKDYSTNRIGQVVLTRNIFLNENDQNSFISNYGINNAYGYGLGIGYIDVYNRFLNKIEDKWFVSHSNAFNSNIGDEVKPEKPSYTKRRILEKCTTNDYFNYYAKNGVWSKDMVATVYKGDSVVADNTYDLSPQEGIIRFHNEVSPASSIYITISESDNRRIFTIIKNSFGKLLLDIRNVGIEFLDEQTTKTTRSSAIPSFASQSIYDTAVVLDSFNISSSLSNTITGLYIPEKTSVSSIQSLNQIPIGNYIPITFGELFEYLNSDLTKSGTYEIVPHQNEWIIGSISKIGSDKNVILLESSESNVKLVLEILEDSDFSNQQYALFKVSGSAAAINKTYNLTIGDTSVSSSGFDFSINQTSETGHLDESPANSSISTYVWSGITDSSADINGNLDYSNKPLKTAMSATELSIRITSDNVATKSPINAKIQIVNHDGLIPESFVGLIDIDVQHFNFSGDSVNYPLFTPVSVLMESSDLNEISQSISINPGVSYVIASISGTGITSVSNPIIYEIGQSGRENLYWGDLNVPSVLSVGRQSPSFIYEYARDVSKLDFCSVVDNYDSIDANKLIQIDRWANYYNSNNQFVTFPSFKFISYNFSNLNKNQGIRTYIFKEEISNTTEMQQDSSGVRPVIKEFDTLYTKLGSSNVFIFNQLSGYNFETSIIGDKYGYNFAQSPNGIKESNISRDDAIEVLSEHGSLEKEEAIMSLVDPQLDNTNHAFLWGALNFDKKLSVIGNSNSVISRPGLYHSELTRESLFPSNNNRPITGVWSTSLNRDSIWAALKAGRSFATSGNRMTLDFNVSVDGSTYKMGDKNGAATRTSLLDDVSINVTSYTEDDARIEIYRYGNFNENNETPTLVSTITISQDSPSTVYSATDIIVADGTDDATSNLIINSLPSTLIYYVKVIQNDKHYCIGSPIYITLS